VGLQVVAHVNGERAQRQVCAAARTARGTGAGNPPVRLEHAGNVVTDFATLDAWEAAGAVPVAQAAFIWTMGDFIPDYLGEYSRSAMFPFRSMLEHGRRCASSSDGAASEMAQFNPMFGVATAMRRLACTGNLVNPEERISLWDAVAMHTVDAAAAMGLSDRGTLAGGQRADIAVLSADITESDPDALAQVEADGLMIGGKFVSDPVPGGRS
jgi:predicted amidohydrolase YtcJ